MSLILPFRLRSGAERGTADPRSRALVVAATAGASPWPFGAFTTRQQGAPWWALLLSGLGLGTAVALLLRLLSWNYSKFQALRQLRVQREAVAIDPPEGPAPSSARLAELVASLKSHAEETREATASLRRSVEQQHRLYQMAATDFQRKLDEASKRKNGSAYRMEVAPESMQLLRSLVSCKQGAPKVAKENGDARTVLSDAETALQQLLRGANAAEAKKALQTLSMILQNLTSHPTQGKYKEVSTSSTRFQETFEGSEAALNLLKLAGECFKWNGQSMTDAERIRDFLQEALRDERYKSTSTESPQKGDVQSESLAPWASSVVQQQLSKLSGST